MADDTTKGFGQQDPADSVGGFNPHAFAIAQQIARISTIKIVKVMAVDAENHTVDVQIAVNQLDGQNNSTPHGTTYGIPYAWAMGGKNAFEIDPAVGDLGVMVVNDRDISAVKNTKAIANPGSLRKFSPSDGVYLFGIPGLNGTAPVQWIKWTDDGIDIKANHGNELTSGADGWVFTGPVEFKAAVTADTTIDVKGAVTAESTLDVKGATTLEAAVTANTTLDVKGAVTLESTVDIKGGATLEAGMSLSGNLTGALGATYTGNFITTGEVIAGFGGVDQVGLQTHIHLYLLATGPNSLANSREPTAGS